MERPFQRSSHDAVIFGVCGGVARYLNWDPTLVRVLFVLGAIFTQGGVVVGYLILAIVMPRESREGTVTGDVIRENLDEMAQRTRDIWDDVWRGSRRQASVGGGETDSIHRYGQPVIAGTVLILAGIILLLDSLRVFAWWQFGRLWPLILIGVGVVILLRRRES